MNLTHTITTGFQSSLPPRQDPRWLVALMLASYLVLGVTTLGFNREPTTILAIIGFAAMADVILNFFLRGGFLFPLSAMITGSSLSILLNYSHGSWIVLVPVFLAIASKYVITIGGRHLYNPALFAIVVCLLFSDNMITAAPAYQWGGTLSVSIFISTAALMFFVVRIKRIPLVLSFLTFFILFAAVRAWLTRWHVPPEMIFMGAASSPAFYLFTFFMLTDPKTSPNDWRLQVLMGFAIALVDLTLHKIQLYNTHFFAAFIVMSLWILVAHIGRFRPSSLIKFWTTGARCKVTGAWLRRFTVTAVFLGVLIIIVRGPETAAPVTPGFQLVKVPQETSGIMGRPSDILQQVDERVAHIAKWLLSIGDAVAINDFDQDGYPDLFLTGSLKDPRDRAALYRNLGGFRFERIPLPALTQRFADPRRHGLPAGALWFDYDNDGDDDLLVLTGYGPPVFLANQLMEQGRATFQDRTEAAGLSVYLNSVTANALDIDRDGILDLIIGNVAPRYLRGYEENVPFNIFDLPDAAYPGDRRMFDFMHRSWHDASNGGRNLLFRGSRKGQFTLLPAAEWGLGQTRWTMDLATADVNRDGWTDVYAANDFGPDRLYLNQKGAGFQSLTGNFVTAIGRDTYKGMTATAADFDHNGYPDIYVSNVHAPLQAEGSLLWMNRGRTEAFTAQSFQDEAWARGALNEHRFGWGAAAVDINRDGLIDILQANGHIDDAYDRTDGKCADYWYWNDKIALTGPDIHGYADQWADLRGRCIFPHQKNRVYLNQGDRFVDVADRVGWGNPGNSRGIGTADFDNDGDIDILVTHQTAPTSLWENIAPPGNWVGLRLEGNGQDCNRDALGTRLTISYHDQESGELKKQYREIQASNGFSAQSEERIIIGLGNHNHPVTLQIKWCGYGQQERHELGINRYHHLRQQENP